VDENVQRFEPKLALFVNDDPIYFYKTIIQFSKKYINNNGKIYFEINDKYYSDLFKHVRDANLSYSFVKDLNRKFRFLIINL
jgi:release factor glutamine methyltransferase